MDSIISGDGNEPYPASAVYGAENATLSDAAATWRAFAATARALAAVGNLRGNAQSTITFDHVMCRSRELIR
jgi:hypothetical protein